MVASGKKSNTKLQLVASAEAPVAALVPAPSPCATSAPPEEADHASPFQRCFSAALRAERGIGELLESAWQECSETDVAERLRLSAFALMAHEDPYADHFEVAAWNKRFTDCAEQAQVNTSGEEAQFWLDSGKLFLQLIDFTEDREQLERCIARVFNGYAVNHDTRLYLATACLAKTANGQFHATSQAFVERVFTSKWFDHCSRVLRSNWYHYVGYMYFSVEDYEVALEQWQTARELIRQLEDSAEQALASKDAMHSLRVLLSVAASRVYMERNQLAKALEELESIKSLARAGTADARLLFHHAMGRQALRTHKPTEALNHLEVAREILKMEKLGDGYSPVVLNEYLQTLMVLDRWQDAERYALEFQRTTSRSHGYFEALRLIAITHQKYESRDVCSEQEYLDSLEIALQYAESHSMRMLLRSAPEIASWLCAQGLENELHTEFLREIIRVRKLPVPKRAPRQWPWAVWLNLIGPFSIILDGDPLVLTGKVSQKPLELIKLLACTKRNTLGLERAAMLLWPDNEDYQSSKKNLEVTIARARKLIGDASIRVSEGRVVLDHALVGSDVQHFLEVCEDLETIHRKQTNGDYIQKLAEQLNQLYIGELLQADEETSWLIAARDQVRSAFVRATLSLIRALGTGAECAEIKSILLEKAIAANPLTEQLYLALMKHYLSIGRQADALTVYRRCKQSLSVLAGLSPSRETEEVRAKLF